MIKYTNARFTYLFLKVGDTAKDIAIRHGYKEISNLIPDPFKEVRFLYDTSVRVHVLICISLAVSAPAIFRKLVVIIKKVFFETVYTMLLLTMISSCFTDF